MRQNLDWDKEISEQSDEDWVLGAESLPDIMRIPEFVRDFYLPTGELQNIGGEKNDCASRAPVNLLEAKFNYAYAMGLLTDDNVAWLKVTGYLKNDHIEFSDRFIAIVSGTTRYGNSLKAPLEAIREYGLIPKQDFPQEGTFEQYYNKNLITEKMYELGREFRCRFIINYDKVLYGQLHVLDDMIDIGGYAWTTPINGVYPKTPTPTMLNHAFLIIRPRYYIFDNYLDENREGDFIKQLAPDYRFSEYGYRVFISKQTTKEEQDTIRKTYDVLKTNNLLRFFVDWFTRFIIKLGMKT